MEKKPCCGPGSTCCGPNANNGCCTPNGTQSVTSLKSSSLRRTLGAFKGRGGTGRKAYIIGQQTTSTQKKDGGS